MNKYEDHELIILETGRMGEPLNGLRKMSIGRHRYVEIKEGDLVYIVTTPSISKEAVVARVENLIYKAGGTVKSITKNLRVSGHGNARDLQLMLNIMKPKYLSQFKGSIVNWMLTLRLRLKSVCIQKTLSSLSVGMSWLLKRGFCP